MRHVPLEVYLFVNQGDKNVFYERTFSLFKGSKSLCYTYTSWSHCHEIWCEENNLKHLIM